MSHSANVPYQLVQTGKFFKDAASENPEDLVTAKDVLTEVGNSANRRFHEALDELEIEFVRTMNISSCAPAVVTRLRAV